eukprot:6188119-Pleurochrysis_carterae.AAC.2
MSQPRQSLCPAQKKTTDWNRSRDSNQRDYMKQIQGALRKALLSEVQDERILGRLHHESGPGVHATGHALIKRPCKKGKAG